VNKYDTVLTKTLNLWINFLWSILKLQGRKKLIHFFWSDVSIFRYVEQKKQTEIVFKKSITSFILSKTWKTQGIFKSKTYKNFKN